MKLSAKIIQDRISEICTDFSFEYKGVTCGVDPFNLNNFDMWCGDKLIAVDSIDKVMNMPFFLGKPLKDIYNDIEIVNF